MKQNKNDRPLIEHCEGADADDLSSLMAAWFRIWRQQPKPSVTDLHCEQFIRLIFAIDKSGSGVQWTYYEIAEKLRVTIATARKIVERTVKEWGLVAVVEERYARGGQAANRYSINWQTCRAVNAGLASRNEIKNAHRGGGPAATTAHPAATTAHPAATTAHPAATTAQPYKESTSITTSISSSIHSLPPKVVRAAHGGGLDPWEVVVSDLLKVGMTGDPRGAARAAQQRGMTIVEVNDWISRYVQLTAAEPRVTIGHLHRWLTGRSKPPWLVPKVEARKPSTSLMSDRDRMNHIENRIIRMGRRSGKSETEIQSEIASAMKVGGFVEAALQRIQ